MLVKYCLVACAHLKKQQYLMFVKDYVIENCPICKKEICEFTITPITVKVSCDLLNKRFVRALLLPVAGECCPICGREKPENSNYAKACNFQIIPLRN